MATARALFLAAVAVAAVLGTAHGASYTVGAPAGSWDLQTNYTSWASGLIFRAGDQLVFKYSRGAHDVVEVSKAGYDSCSASAPLATFATGDDTVALPAGAVTRYFICGVPGHCAGGMRLAVRVEAAAPSPAPVAKAPRAAARPPASSAPSPAPVPAMAPRAAPAIPPASSAPSPAPVPAMAPRAAPAIPPASSAPSPAPVPAMAPRAAAARPPLAVAPGASVPAPPGDRAAVPPPSSAAAASAGVGSLGGLGFGAAMAALMALY